MEYMTLKNNKRPKRQAFITEAEIKGYQIVEAIIEVEKGKPLSPHLENYRGFAEIHIENNQ
jgi:hypothetical protein